MIQFLFMCNVSIHVTKNKILQKFTLWKKCKIQQLNRILIYASKNQYSSNSDEDKDTMITGEVESLHNFSQFVKKQSESPSSSRKSSTKSESSFNSSKERNLKIETQFKIMDQEHKIQKNSIKQSKNQLKSKENKFYDLQQTIKTQIYEQRIQSQTKNQKRTRSLSGFVNQQGSHNLSNQGDVLKELKSYQQKLFSFESFGQKTGLTKAEVQDFQKQIYNQNLKSNTQAQTSDQAIVEILQSRNSKKANLKINIPKIRFRQQSIELNSDQAGDQVCTPKFKLQSSNKYRSQREKCLNNENTRNEQQIYAIEEVCEDICTDNYF